MRCSSRYLVGLCAAMLTLSCDATGPQSRIPAHIEVAGGSGQQSAAGTQLADSIAVIVRDRYGNPVRGTEVVWSTQDGGSFSPPISLTGNDGVARTVWTLGSSVANQSAEARHAEFSASFTATATGIPPVVSLITLTPNQDSIFTGDTIEFVATAFDASGGEIPTPSLTWSSSEPAIAAVSQTGQVVSLARGSAVINASDGATAGTATLTVLRRDSVAPSLTVDAPINYTVGRPDIRLAASCTDDDPLGCEIVVKVLGWGRWPSTEIARGRDVLDTVVSLVGFTQGVPLQLSFSAHDPVNASRAERVVIVETSAALSPELDVAGRIIDADAQRVLYVDAADSSTVRIHDRIAGTDQVIFGPADLWITYGALTSAGALLLNKPSAFTPERILEWRGSGVIDHGQPDAVVSIRVAGDHAIWSLGATLIRHDIAAGTSTVVATDAGNWGNDVTANGDVVYWSHAFEIIRYREGIATPLANEGGGPVWHYGVRTDGSLLVFTKHDPCCALFDMIVLSNGSSVTLDASTFEPVAGRDYQVRAGRVAYTRADAGGLEQVWTWTPAEGARQITNSTWSELESMGPAGEVVVNTAGKRLLWTPSGSGLRDIGSASGNVQWIGADLFVALGRTLFRVN